jgi:hypothetical protein
MLELSQAKIARGGRAALLISHEPFDAAKMPAGRHEALRDYVTELDLEAPDYGVDFIASDSEYQVADSLLTFI